MQTETLRELAATVRGPVIDTEDDRYDQTRAVYNAMIDRRPDAVVEAADVADVIATVEQARRDELLLAVRGGGHNGPGFGTCDDGLVLDLSRMNGIRVDPEARTARVEGGCVWGDVDHATHAFGLATPSGILSTTGVGGLTLGGGHGYLSRRWGLTVDNLREADVVLADGRLVKANEDQEPELFWAIRGGGGNFGVVTSFLFDLHPVDTVVGGPTLWPLDKTGEVLRWYRHMMPSAPEELYGFFAVMAVPPSESFPEELHGEKVCGVVWCHTGPTEKAKEELASVLDFGPPIFEHVGELPYPALQSAFDALYPPGHQWYWKGDFVREIPEEAVAVHQEYAERLPTPQSTMHLYPIDGAVHRHESEDTAFAQREANWSMVIAGVDPDPAKADGITAWARDYWRELHPHTLGGSYVNFMMDEGEDRLRATYGDNYDRLRQVKRRYDPDNLFRVNQNIKPAD